MIKRVIKALEDSKIELTHTEIADALWLALKMNQAEKAINKDAFVDEQETQNPNNSLNQKPAVVDKSTSTNTPLAYNNNKEKKEKETQELASLHIPANRLTNSTNQQVKSRPIRIPTEKTLPDHLGISRALRPLMQKTPSKTEFIIDEPLTVRRIKEENIWIPVLKPVLTQRYNLELIIDSSESMSIWQKTIAEFEVLLQTHGAFGNVKSWLLATDQTDIPLSKKTNNLTQSPSRTYKNLTNIDSNHLILIVSDCVSKGWYENKVAKLLNLWSETNCVAILQVFPKTLWRHTALDENIMVEIQTLAGKVNSKLKSLLLGFDHYQQYDDDNTASNSNKNKNKLSYSAAIPIITFDPTIIHSWANSLAGIPNHWVVGTKFLLDKVIENNKKEGKFQKPVNS